MPGKPNPRAKLFALIRAYPDASEDEIRELFWQRCRKDPDLMRAYLDDARRTDPGFAARVLGRACRTKPAVVVEAITQWKMRNLLELAARLKPGENATAHGFTVERLADGRLRWSSAAG
jgi:hypothetical protein